jgi:hypothetical protein
MQPRGIGARVGGNTALPGYVASRGGSPERVLRDADVIESELADSEAWIELDRIAALYEAAARELDDPHFGLAFGATLPLQSFGLISYVVLNAADVETALRNLARYSSALSITGVAAESVVSGDVARLVFTIDSRRPADRRQYFEGIAVVLCIMMKTLVGETWAPREISFEHEPAGSRAEVERRLGGPVKFSANRHSIAFDAAVLERAVPGADRSLLPVIEKRVHEIVGHTEADPIVARLRAELARALCDGKPDIRTIARRLALSPRTLQRRLRD